MIIEELIQSAKKGNQNSLVELLRIIEPQVYRIAYYMLGNQEDALDASQESLIKIYTKIDTYQEKAKFTTWVQRIVNNVCIDKYRKKKESVPIDDHEFFLQDKANVEKEVEWSETAKDVKKAIAKLPEAYRTVVIMRYIEDLSYNEIAETLDMPLNTVKSYLFRARQELQGMLKEYQRGGVKR